MPIMLSESEGLGAAFATLVCFFLVTVAFAYTQRSKSYDADTYMVARNTQGVLSLTLSFFASGAGAWIVFAVPEAAILGGPLEGSAHAREHEVAPSEVAPVLWCAGCFHK